MGMAISTTAGHYESFVVGSGLGVFGCLGVSSDGEFLALAVFFFKAASSAAKSSTLSSKSVYSVTSAPKCGIFGCPLGANVISTMYRLMISTMASDTEPPRVSATLRTKSTQGGGMTSSSDGLSLPGSLTCMVMGAGQGVTSPCINHSKLTPRASANRPIAVRRGTARPLSYLLI